MEEEESKTPQQRSIELNNCQFLGVPPLVLNVAHTLQLCMKSGFDLPVIDHLTAVSRKFVCHFKHSVVAMTALREKSAKNSLTLPHSKCHNTLEFSILHASAPCWAACSCPCCYAWFTERRMYSRQADIYMYEKSTYQLASVGLAQAHSNK